MCCLLGLRTAGVFRSTFKTDFGQVASVAGVENEVSIVTHTAN